MILQSPKGMRDILPVDQLWWDRVKKISQDIADFYNFSRIDTPILESAEIFEKSTGSATDIVEKQIYYIKSKGKDRLALRPEGTAGIVRAYSEHGLSRLSQPLKLYYFGPFFATNRPRPEDTGNFIKLVLKSWGESDPVYDAQVILAGYRLIEELKIKNLTIEINSLGCRSCRAVYRRKLQDYYKKFRIKICRDCRRRLSLNPLRLLDCKNENCQAIKTKAPIMMDHLCSACRSHFRLVLEYLDELSLSYILNPYLVRGLDYYNRTVFEFTVDPIAKRVGSLGGGGRYDDLGEMLGAKKGSLPAIGASLGVERLIEAMKEQGTEAVFKSKIKVFWFRLASRPKRGRCV